MIRTAMLYKNRLSCLVAKNNKTHEYLVEKMKQGEMTKKYLAVVKGVIEEDEFTKRMFETE